MCPTPGPDPMAVGSTPSGRAVPSLSFDRSSPCSGRGWTSSSLDAPPPQPSSGPMPGRESGLSGTGGLRRPADNKFKGGPGSLKPDPAHCEGLLGRRPLAGLALALAGRVRVFYFEGLELHRRFQKTFWSRADHPNPLAESLPIDLCEETFKNTTLEAAKVNHVGEPLKQSDSVGRQHPLRWRLAAGPTGAQRQVRLEGPDKTKCGNHACQGHGRCRTQITSKRESCRTSAYSLGIWEALGGVSGADRSQRFLPE